MKLETVSLGATVVLVAAVVGLLLGHEACKRFGVYVAARKAAASCVLLYRLIDPVGD